MRDQSRFLEVILQNLFVGRKALFYPTSVMRKYKYDLEKLLWLAKYKPRNVLRQSSVKLNFENHYLCWKVAPWIHLLKSFFALSATWAVKQLKMKINISRMKIGKLILRSEKWEQIWSTSIACSCALDHGYMN